MYRALFLLVLTAISLPVSAHVKWFVDDEGKFSNTHFHVDLLGVSIFIGAFIYILLGSVLQRHAQKSDIVNAILCKPLITSNIYPLLKFTLFILLLGNIIQGHFIAPNIPIDSQSKLTMLAQAALIILLAFDSELFAIALLITSSALFYFYGWNDAIDYFFELISVAIAIGLMSPVGEISRRFNIKKYTNECKLWGLTALRLGLGMQLMVLALHDKLLNPGLSLHFLENYPYFNFMRLLGFDQFTDLHFVLSGGLAEFSFGLLLFANIAQRMAALTVLFFFTLTGIILGPAELLGHIPIMAVVIILLLKPAPNITWLWLKTKKTFASTSLANHRNEILR